MYNSMRTHYRVRLEEEIEEMIENGELDPDEADTYFQEKMEDWDWGYGDMMYDIYKDAEFGY